MDLNSNDFHAGTSTWIHKIHQYIKIQSLQLTRPAICSLPDQVASALTAQHLTRFLEFQAGRVTYVT
jgi:hypothetical protein